MTSTNIMSYLDDHKELIPDGIYLGLANLLKEKHQKDDNSDYKLVEIVYQKTKIVPDTNDSDYTILGFTRCKRVFVRKNDEFFTRRINNHLQNNFNLTPIEFENVDGMETVKCDSSYEKDSELLSIDANPKAGPDETLWINFHKYMLISITDVVE